MVSIEVIYVLRVLLYKGTFAPSNFIVLRLIKNCVDYGLCKTEQWR